MDELKQLREGLETLNRLRATLLEDTQEEDALGNWDYSAGSVDPSRELAQAAESVANLALEALARLEAREAEQPSAAELVKNIRAAHAVKGSRGGFTGITEPALSSAEAAALIGQYAYRYSEDIRKERDEWKELATKFRDAVNEMGAV